MLPGHQRPMLQRSFVFLLLTGFALVTAAPLLIAAAPYESTMGLIQKIFYFHVPSWIAMFTAITVCGVASVRYLATRSRSADRLAVSAAELTVVFGLIGLLTGPLWGRKAWGVYWQWDAKLTTALVLWLIFVAYNLLRRFGGPGSERLAAGVALFGMANVPFVYWSAHIWRTVHPKTSVVMTLGPGMRPAFYWSAFGFLLIFGALLAARTRLEALRASIDDAYLSAEDL
jgi:heme exporter protein C